MSSSYILGISAYYHDSAAALLKDGNIIAAAQEERFSRKKHDAAFPAHAIHYCLKQAGITLTECSAVVFYDKPLLKFDRLLYSYLINAPHGFVSFCTTMPVWLKDKLYLKDILNKELTNVGCCGHSDLPVLLFTDHHKAHAASAFYPSPYEKAAVLCLDGVGEWATTTVWNGHENELTPLWRLDFPHSLGLLYSAFTYYTGFKVNSGEYKLMGLAPYGSPKYVNRILENVIDLKPDGTFHLNMHYFGYATGLRMTNEHFDKLFDGPVRQPESELSQKEMDIASSIQWVTEEIVLRLARTAAAETGQKNLCLAGGVALNCVANGRLLREGPFQDIWIQPAAGDAGGALGSALAVWHEYEQNSRTPVTPDAMHGAYLGPGFSNDEIMEWLDSNKLPYKSFTENDLVSEVSDMLADGLVVGWFQGRMEFGPRALCARSILGDARNAQMQSKMNLKIKFRESFRPFAPVVKYDKVGEWFNHRISSPYMLIVADVLEQRRLVEREDQRHLTGIEKLQVPRSSIPAVTHVDYSARLQTVHPETNPRFYKLLDRFEQKTGCPVLINTSFNVRGEPIVCTPEDAYRCFMRTEMDVLVLENCLLKKADQPQFQEQENWRDEYVLD